MIGDSSDAKRMDSTGMLAVPLKQFQTCGLLVKTLNTVLCSCARHFILVVPLSNRCINGYQQNMPGGGGGGGEPAMD